MRKRQIKEEFYVNVDERKILEEKVAKAKITKSNYFRSLIMEKDIKEKPGEKFYNFIKDLREMAINLNKLTMIAHKTGDINISQFETLRKEIEDFIIKVKKQFLN